MSRKRDNYSSRPRGLTSHFGSSPLLGSQYNPYSSNFSNSLNSKSYRNFNPYTGYGRSSPNLGIYGGTSSGYGGVYLNGPGVLSSLNLMSPVLRNLDKKLVASQKNFKPKEIVPLKIKEPVPLEAPPVRPERKARTVNRSHSFNKEKSRSLTSLDDGGTLSSRSLSLNSLTSDGYCSGSERTSEADTPAPANSAAAAPADARDYKALYEASSAEVRRLRELLNTSEQQLRDARTTISRLTRMSQSSLSEIEKREKRAMERKLSEMEEELKCQQALQAENQRLKDENGALIRVISKLSK